MKTGLPAKYARMGFKKGWAAFRKFKGSKGQFNTKKSSVKIKTKSGTKTTTATVRKVGDMSANKKTQVAALKSRLAGALGRARGAVKMDNPVDALVAVGEGLGAGVASAYALGSIPTPAFIPKPGLVKSGLQLGLGLFLATRKNKHAKYAGFGMAVIGGMSMIREVLPVPTFAGEVDTAMFGEEYAGEGMGEGELLGWDEMGDPVYAGDPLGDPLGEPVQSAAFNPYG